jgi:hypothetical protein
MAGSLAPQWFMQIFDDAGRVASGAKMFSYLSGTSTPAPIFADQPCHVPLNSGGDDGPWTLDAAGRGEFWLLDGITYRLRIETADGVMLVDRSGITGGGGGGTSPSGTGIATLEAFPPKDINWLSDSAGDLWDKSDAQLAFRIDFMTKGYNFLRFFRTIFSGNNGNPSGKFAIYGNLDTKLYEDTLPDFDNYALVEFSVPIGISDYDFISVVMDAGLTGIPQPIAQSIKFIPAATALSRYAFAGTFQHEKNTVFPETCPGMLYTDIKYFLARWCAIGVQ